MALIKPKNLIMPFKSGVNVVTIILFVLLFGAYRLAGGGIVSKKNNQSVIDSKSQLPLSATSNQTEKAPVGFQKDTARREMRPSAFSEDAFDIDKTISGLGITPGKKNVASSSANRSDNFDFGDPLEDLKPGANRNLIKEQEQKIKEAGAKRSNTTSNPLEDIEKSLGMR
ncbi:MAG TPA: hypothetical protein PKD37_07120 [Oligoflexia bacterium]|nr:hypothetical protein [Oligoflexia bacterium]HMP27734.1 hypothetical protein [Oligoflexia bacterium]